MSLQILAISDLFWGLSHTDSKVIKKFSNRTTTGLASRQKPNDKNGEKSGF